MFDVPQAVDPLPAAPVAIVHVPAKTKCGTSDDGEIVVCGRVDKEQYRLRPLPQRASEPNFLYRPHLVKIGPLRVGLLGGAVGTAMDF